MTYTIVARTIQEFIDECVELPKEDAELLLTCLSERLVSRLNKPATDGGPLEPLLRNLEQARAQLFANLADPATLSARTRAYLDELMIEGSLQPASDVSAAHNSLLIRYLIRHEGKYLIQTIITMSRIGGGLHIYHEHDLYPDRVPENTTEINLAEKQLDDWICRQFENDGAVIARSARFKFVSRSKSDFVAQLSNLRAERNAVTRELTELKEKITELKEKITELKAGAQSNAEAVREFTEASRQLVCPDQPRPLTEERVTFLLRMIMSELDELACTVTADPASRDWLMQTALDIRDRCNEFSYPSDELRVAAQGDAIVDAWYYGLNVFAEHGLNLSRLFELVHAANLAKRNPATGQFDRRASDGKIMKPAGWSPPDIVAEVQRQQREGAWSRGLAPK
jgi:predicted HAD superfamily Cof-like phosphohydrolase